MRCRSDRPPPLASAARLPYGARPDAGPPMLIKIIAFISAAIPLILFLRSVFGGRQTKLGQALREFKKQIDVAIYLFLGLIGCVVAFGLGKLVWTWWTTL
jgi:hypothetical protein